MTLLLFIYGTLHPDRAQGDIADTARLLKPLGRATIEGRRYELGEYPGVVLAKDLGAGDAGEAVHGELFLLPEGLDGQEAVEVLSRLDAYEDYRPGDPGRSLFLRQLTTTTLKDGSRARCWVYTYNGDAKGFKR